jgi:hypothetical protein
MRAAVVARGSRRTMTRKRSTAGPATNGVARKGVCGARNPFTRAFQPPRAASQVGVGFSKDHALSAVQGSCSVLAGARDQKVEPLVDAIDGEPHWQVLGQRACDCDVGAVDGGLVKAATTPPLRWPGADDRRARSVRPDILHCLRDRFSPDAQPLECAFLVSSGGVPFGTFRGSRSTLPVRTISAHR